VDVLVSRRGELKTIKLPVVDDKPASWALEVRPDATPDQKARLKAWLMQ
jgi:hypothetical protein